MTHPQQPKDDLEDKIYEILYKHEGDLSDGYGYYGGERDVLLISEEIANLIRSRPSPAPAYGTPENPCKICICADSIRTAAARQARTKLLNGLLVWIQENEQFTGCDNIDGFEIYGVLSTDIKKHMKSLRQEP